MHRFKSKYLPALDGLRGFAILLVICHHQLIPFSFNGGFLAVDLFFVLSGFLITTLLLTEFDATHTISLKDFYLRRALRLGPALVLYLLVSLVVTYYQHPEEFAREIRLAALALSYCSNWRLALGWDMSLDPTAIIWSLSIEEQFYLAWPLALFVCLFLRVKPKHLIVGLIVVISAICLHRLQLFSGGAELNRLYYGTDTRADAPLMGCLSAFIARYTFSDIAKRLLNGAMVVAAGSLIYLIVSIHFTDRFLYLGGYTVVALLSGIVVLTSALMPSTPIVKLLHWRPLRWFGKISYGLYLWHWLLLKATSFYFWVGPTWDPWARFVTALLVSAISFYFIESPFNRLKSRFSFDSGRRKQVTERIPTTAKLPNTVLIQPSEQNI